MKVKELVAWLQTQDPELEIMRESWETGDLSSLNMPIVVEAVKVDVLGYMVWKRREEYMDYKPVDTKPIVGVI